MNRLTSIVIGILTAISCVAQINIWEGTECHKKVKLTPYIVEGDNNIGVVICPGGSYFWHDSETEGHDVAKWLNKNGISAF